jgi:toxin ParE1/3/4
LPKVTFSRLARTDLQSIDEYTESTWGGLQADRYLHDLRTFCSTLAQMPELGRRWNSKQSGLRQMEHGKHVIFYRRNSDGILILRILHQSMLPERQFFASEET